MATKTFMEVEYDPTEEPVISISTLWVIFCLSVIALLLVLNSPGAASYTYGLYFSIALATVPFRSYQSWMKNTVMGIFGTLWKLFKILAIVGSFLLAIMFFLRVGYLGLSATVKIVVPDKWTLMVCETKMGNECYDTYVEIPGFKSSMECMLEGATRFRQQGFECGSNCKKDFGTVNVCDVICNANGCN